MSGKRSHHGNTPAAWVTVTIAFLAFIIGGAGILLASAQIFWAGVVVFVISGFVGKIMQMAGYGQHPRS
ncbi:MAG: hypothetical protein RLZZ330_849 [Actinomycetota bacterium]|jgi:hypothetical protein